MEAALWGEQAKRCEARNVYGTRCRRSDAHKRERGCAIPGEICNLEELNPLLRGWINYFKLTQTKGVLEELDSWMRRRLRCLMWRQWKRPATRVRKLRALGLSAERARLSGGNGHGPWWNAGGSNMNMALSTKYFTMQGLVSLLGTQQRLQSFS